MSNKLWAQRSMGQKYPNDAGVMPHETAAGCAPCGRAAGSQPRASPWSLYFTKILYEGTKIEVTLVPVRIRVLMGESAKF